MATPIKLILLEDVEELGHAGDTVKVAPGYARNYLLPRNLAATITKGALRRLESNRERIETKRRSELDGATALAKALAELELTIPMQAGDDDRLFGSVTAHLLAEEFAKRGLTIEAKRILLAEPIKTIGEFSLEVRLHAEVTAPVKVWVVKS